MSKNSGYVKALRERRRQLVRDTLGNECAKCGETEGLQADHIDPATKLFTIAEGLQKALPVFMAELAKCQMLCQPCHTEKTNRDLATTVCPHGHARTPDNLTPTGRCRECQRAAKRRYKERRQLVTQPLC